jgi:hypothetical protein
MIIILCFGCCEVQHHRQNGWQRARSEGSIVFGFDSLRLSLAYQSKQKRADLATGSRA